MSSEELKTDLYEQLAKKAFEDCISVMRDILPIYGDNLPEFIYANAYVAGGLLSSTLAFADNNDNLIALRHHLLNTMAQTLDTQIAAMTTPEGKGN